MLKWNVHVGAVTIMYMYMYSYTCTRRTVNTRIVCGIMLPQKFMQNTQTRTHTHIICDRTHGHCQSHAWSLCHHGGGGPLTVLRSIHTVLATTTEHQKYSCTLCAGWIYCVYTYGYWYAHAWTCGDHCISRWLATFGAIDTSLATKTTAV